MNKYYTPEIEEFHVGFEYESLGIISTVDGSDPRRWKKGYNKILPSNLEQLIRGGKIRVKYLDREDIESLGFIGDTINEFHMTNLFFENKEGNKWISVEYFDENKGYYLSIDEDESQFSFAGYVKNKNELKRLLNQLNIL